MKKILVFGATGKQGQAFIDAIGPDRDFEVLALSRNSGSPTSKRLESHDRVKVVVGDANDQASLRKIFDAAGGKGAIWGIFCVLAFPGLGANADGEEKQGKLIADLALEYNTELLIFSSVERGGTANDDRLTLDRRAKANIEQHIQSLGEKGLGWTILRPGFFMENLEGGYLASLTAAMLKYGLSPTTRTQLIAVKDIGAVAAAIFRNPEAHKGKCLIVVGENLTASEMDAAYMRGAGGKHMPSASPLMVKLLLKVNKQTREFAAESELISSLVEKRGAEYEAELAETRSVYPDMTSFEAWVREHYQAPQERQKGWNQLSLKKLFLGKT